jgi:hypothetical protein
MASILFPRKKKARSEARSKATDGTSLCNEINDAACMINDAACINGTAVLLSSL